MRRLLLIPYLICATSACDLTRVPSAHQPPEYWDETSGTRYNIRAGWPGDLGAVRVAVEVWNTVSCSSFWFNYQGITNERQIGDGITTIQFVEVEDDWIRGRHLIGVTVKSYRMTTGEIVDADIFINGVDFEYTRGFEAPTANQYDMRSVLTHESGHVVGQSHIDEPDAVMHVHLSTGEMRRHLHRADMEFPTKRYPSCDSD